MTFTIEEASTQLAHLIEMAASGEEVYIPSGGAPAVRLAPVAVMDGEHTDTPLLPRVPGLGKGQMWIASDFDSPMPDDWLDSFYNGEIFPSKPLRKHADSDTRSCCASIFGSNAMVNTST